MALPIVVEDVAEKLQKLTIL